MFSWIKQDTSNSQILDSQKLYSTKMKKPCQFAELLNILLPKWSRSKAITKPLIGGALDVSFMKWSLVFLHIEVKIEWNCLSQSFINHSKFQTYYTYKIGIIKIAKYFDETAREKS